MPFASRLIRRVRAQSGYTLIEVVVACSLGVVVLLAVALFAETARRSQVRTGERTDALRQQTLGLERMTREIRQAVALRVNSSEQVDADTYVRIDSGAKVRRWVRFDCSAASECRRYLGDASGAFTSAPTTLITGVQNSAVFAGLRDGSPDVSDPEYVEIKVRVRLPGQDNLITLADGVDLRNDPS